ncbi:M36 family metallopeptidase [Emticicia sp. BO119]|uniref:Ig-like domain-containing protein n=1 Tax=Emticicia sp. BO119 TaxID=2757768 RepID=UPI0015F02621|nr:M36 family metallopeptidase [Emticicia sp. BO119]MBA4853001.1 M36 family metallopeptidase [Emticicia sp. BO119]
MTKHLFSENSIYKKCCLLLFALTLSITLHAQKEAEKIKTYLRANADKYQLSVKDIDEMSISSAYLSPTTGWYHVYFNQTYQSIDVHNGLLNATIVNDNVAHIANNFVANIAARIQRDSSGILLSPLGALTKAAQSLNLTHNPLNSREISNVPLPNGQIGKAIYTNADLSDENIEIKLYWLPYNTTNNEGKRDIPKIKLSWDVRILSKDHKNAWSVQLDAVSGEVLKTTDKIIRCNFGGRAHTHFPNEDIAREHTRETIVPISVAPNSYNVFDYPLESPNHGSRTIVTNPYTKFTTSGTGPGNTNGWHHTADNSSYTTTRGNNVWAKEDRNADNEGTIGASPDSPTLEFDYSYTQGPGTSTANQNAAITNLFYWNNLIHDVLWKYGFDESAGNFQQNNMSRGGNGNDFVYADAQDGSGSDNANFYTPSDGANPRMQMFLWSTGGNPQYQPDSDFDNAVIAHEYGHGWSIRLTGGPTNVDCLWNDEQGGEGWSDYLGLMLTTDWSLLTPSLASANIPRGIGTYVLTEPTNGDGIRPYRYSYDMANINAPVTYGKVATYAVPHGVGSIWATMLWDMTWEIIMQDNRIVNNIYNTTELVGNAAAFKLVNEGLRLQSCSPSFIDARNAILEADQLLFNGRYRCAIWKAFARRGLGLNASTGGSSDDTYVIEDFTPATDRPLTSPLNVTVCSGSPLTYNATTSAGGATTFNWTRAAVAGISNAAASGSTATVNETLVNTTSVPITVVYRFYLTPSLCPGSQDVSVTVNPSPIAEVSAYSVCQDGVVPQGEGLVMISSPATDVVNGTLTSNSPTYVRGYGNRTTTYYPAASVYYQTHTFTPTVSGYVTFETIEAILTNGSDDNYLSLYQHSFDPNNPANNFLMGDDDSGYGWYASIEYPVVAGTTYILVGSTYVTGYTGTYRVAATMPVFGGLTQWFTSSSGGSPIATGNIFNPVGVLDSGVPNTATPATTVFYAGSTGSTCRTQTTFTINPYTMGGNLEGSTTVCGSNNSGTITLSGHVGSVIRWESSTNNFNDITIINDTTTTLVYSNIVQTTQFRAVVKSGACYEQNSGVATITLLPGESPIVTGASRCDAGILTLTATGCNSGTVNWYTVISGGSIISTGTSYTTPTLSTTTTYYVNCSVSSCAAGRIPVTATITSSTAPATSGGSSCGNASIILTATGCANGIINWYTAASGGSVIATGTSYTTPTLSTTTTYYVGCTINACTSVRASVTATITQTPANPTPVNGGRCGPGSVTLTATGCANGTISWYTTVSGGSAIATGTSFATPGLSTTTTYYINCTVNSCPSNGRLPVTATISAGLAAPSGSGGARCGTGSVTLTAVGCAGTGGGTLSWFTGVSGGVVVGTGESYATPAISATTTYYVACVLGVCSSTRVSVVATVNPAPDSPIPNNVNRCGNGTVTLTTTGCSNGDIYWYTASSGGFAIAVGTSYTTAGLTSSVTYYISCAVGNCASERIPITATVNPIPGTPTTTSNSRCGAGTVILTASGCTGGTINWYTTNSGGSAIATGTSFSTPSINSTTTYYASCVLGPCPSNRIPAIASINPLPGVPVPTGASRCDVGTVTLTATGCSGGTINWYTANSGGSSIAAGTTYTTPNLSTTTTYYAGCTLGVCPSERVSVIATINHTPDVPSLNDGSRCGPGSIGLTATGCTGGTISWYTAISAGSLLTTGGSYTTPNLSTTTTYYVSCTVGSCMSARAPVIATINPNPVAPIPNNGSSCGTGPINLSATGCAGGTINWYTANSGGSSIAAGTSYTTPGISTTTTYYISCTMGSCVSGRVAITATINSVPDVPTPLNTSRCGTGTIGLTATGCNGGTLNWYTSATGSTAIGQGGTFTTPSISATTTYYVACVVGSCASSRASMLAIVNTNLTYAAGNQAAGTYKASQTITSASDISTGTNYFAGQAIMLMPGFLAGGNEVFLARIQDCSQGN